MTEFQVELYTTLVGFILISVLIYAFFKTLKWKSKQYDRLTDKQFYNYMLEVQKTERVKYISKRKCITGLNRKYITNLAEYIILLDEVTMNPKEEK